MLLVNPGPSSTSPGRVRLAPIASLQPPGSWKRNHDGWFLLVAGLVIAGLWLLVAVGVTVRCERLVGHLLAASSCGALTKTTVEAVGDCANAGDWTPVTMFSGLAAATTRSSSRSREDRKSFDSSINPRRGGERRPVHRGRDGPVTSTSASETGPWLWMVRVLVGGHGILPGGGHVGARWWASTSRWRSSRS